MGYGWVACAALIATFAFGCALDPTFHPIVRILAALAGVMWVVVGFRDLTILLRRRRRKAVRW